MIADLPPVTVTDRWRRLRDLMAAEGLDALLVHDRSNIRYLSGFTGSAGELAITLDDAVLLTDGRYRIQAPEQLDAVGAPARVDADARARDDARRDLCGSATIIGLEAATVTWAGQRRLAELLAGERLTPTEGIVERLRSVKDDAELARMEAAASVATAALASVVEQGLAGRTERDVGLALDDHIRTAGASGPAYETIVASGPNSARPHARPTDRTIVAGDLVIIDVGAVVEGYRSDMTRTFSVGAPDDDAARMIEVVTDAQATAVAAVGAGVAVAGIDRAARSVIVDAGMGDLFDHGTGHGVGLDIHEAPAVHDRAEGNLEAGQCITVEPGVYRDGLGGARVEDLLVVTPDGARPLTTAPKEPVLA